MNDEHVHEWDENDICIICYESKYDILKESGVIDYIDENILYEQFNEKEDEYES